MRFGTLLCPVKLLIEYVCDVPKFNVFLQLLYCVTLSFLSTPFEFRTALNSYSGTNQNLNNCPKSGSAHFAIIIIFAAYEAIQKRAVNFD
jgi:hypothetical protein